MLDEYTDAFGRYLRTGTVGALSGFLAGNADPARLRVYRNGFLKACIEALRASYPSVERLVGAERFSALARPYVDAHPPRTASLVEYGERFPKFVEDTSDTHRLAYLAAFAMLDRAWSEVFFAEDAAVAAGGLPADPGAVMNLRGRLSPRARMVSLDHRALDAWSELRQEGLGQRTEIRPVPQQVLVWRDAGQVLYRDLARPEHVFLGCVAAGQRCGDAAGEALRIDAGFDLAGTFASLLHHRILAFEH